VASGQKISVEPSLRARLRASDPDAIGRPGVAVAQTAEGIRTELIFNKTTLRLIGKRTTIASIGLSTDATAIISQAFVNHLGQVPAS
jgi:hypothetical protein